MTGKSVSELHGGGGDDHVYGGDDAKMYGDADNDTLFGGFERSELHGGTGRDVLIGGAGRDLFVYDSLNDSPADENGGWSPRNGDTVVDFDSSSDRFDLRPIQRTVQFRWSGLRATRHGVWVERRSGDTLLFADVDGDRLADVAVRLIGTVKLRAGNVCGVSAPRRWHRFPPGRRSLVTRPNERSPA